MNATSKKSPLSQDLANLLSRVNAEHEPPYKRFRSRSEETFYTINAFDPDDYYGEEVAEQNNGDSYSLFMEEVNASRRHESLANGLLPHNSGETTRSGAAGFTATQKTGQNQYSENNKVAFVSTTERGGGLRSTSSNGNNNKGHVWETNSLTAKTASSSYDEQSNEKGTLNSSNTDKMQEPAAVNCVNEGQTAAQPCMSACDCSPLRGINLQDQTNHTAYKVRNIKQELGLNETNGADIQEEKENIDYTVGSILQNFRRRQEQNNDLVKALPHQRIYNLDDYDVDEFYMDDNVDILGASGGVYPIVRSDKVPDLTTNRALDSISDILNRTLDTIPEEESEELNEHLQSKSVESSAASSHSRAKVQSRPDCNSLMTTPLKGEFGVNDKQVDCVKSSEPMEYTWGQWDDQLNSGYAVSEDLSDIASCVNEETVQGLDKETCRASAKTITSSHSNTRLDQRGEFEVVDNETLSVKNVSETTETEKSSSSKETPWYEEDTHDVGNVSVSEESYHSVASTPSKLPNKSTEHHTIPSQPTLLDSISGSTVHNDSTDTLKEGNKSSDSIVSGSSTPVKVSQTPLTGMARVFDWETADLNSEMAESVVLSDLVSDAETDSKFGSSVSNHPNAAIEAINNLVKEKQPTDAKPVKDEQLGKNFPPSDSVCISSSSTVHSIKSAPGNLGTLPFDSSSFEQIKTPSANGGQNYIKNRDEAKVQNIPEISPSSVKYDLFHPGLSSSQFSMGAELLPETDPTVTENSCIHDQKTSLSESAIENIPRIYVSDGSSSLSGSSISRSKEHRESGERLNRDDSIPDSITAENIVHIDGPISEDITVSKTHIPSSDTCTASCDTETEKGKGLYNTSDTTPQNNSAADYVNISALETVGFTSKRRQRVNESCDPVKDNVNLLQRKIDKWVPADREQSGGKFNTFSKLNNQPQLQEECTNDSESQVNNAQPYATNDPQKPDIRAFSNYSQLTENTHGTMQPAHSRTNSFHSKYTSVSVKSSGTGNEFPTKNWSPVDSTAGMEVNKDRILTTVVGKDNLPVRGSDKLPDSQPPSQVRGQQEKPNAFYVDTNSSESDLQLNNSNNIPSDFTFTVDRTESQVIKIQHTRTIIPPSSHDKDTANIRGNKFLSSHRTMDDVSMIGNNYPFYGDESTTKGQPRTDNSFMQNEPEAENIQNERHLVKPTREKGTLVKEALVSHNGVQQSTDPERDNFNKAPIYTEGPVKMWEEFHKPVILTQTNQPGTDQKGIDQTDNGNINDTSQFRSNLSTMGNTNIVTQQALSPDNSEGAKKAGKILWKPFAESRLMSSSAEYNGKEYLYDGFHGVNSSYSQGYSNNGIVNDDLSHQQTVAYDTFRTQNTDEQGGYMHTETTTTQHVLNQPLSKNNPTLSDEKFPSKKTETDPVDQNSTSPYIPSKSLYSNQLSTPDVATNIILHGSLEDEKQEEMKSSHNYENVYVAPYIPKPKTCTAMATSTALARKDFRLIGKNNMGNMSGDSVVSAVASAEATGESPYVAVARATARAATIATASAAKGASQGEHIGYEDKRDVTIMISTSCTLKDDEGTDIKKSSEDVIEALRGDANVAVYTRLAPNPNAVLSTDQYQSQPSPQRKLKVSIEQPLVENSGKHASECTTVEISIPCDIGEGELSHMINDSVNKMLVSQKQAEVLHQPQPGEAANYGSVGENGALTIYSKGRGTKGIESNMQNVNLMGSGKGNAPDAGILSLINTEESITEGNTCDSGKKTATAHNECCMGDAVNYRHNRESGITSDFSVSDTTSRIDNHKKSESSRVKAIEINNNNTVTHGVTTRVENTNQLSCDVERTPPSVKYGDTTMDVEDEKSVYSTESSVLSHKHRHIVEDHELMDATNIQQSTTYVTNALNYQENQSQLQAYTAPESRVKINEARRRFLEDYNGRSVVQQQTDDVKGDNSLVIKGDSKKKKKKKKKHNKKESSSKTISHSPKTGRQNDKTESYMGKEEKKHPAMNGPCSSVMSTQGDPSKDHANPDRRGFHVETHSWQNSNTRTDYTDYHSSGATNPRNNTDQLKEFSVENGDTENHMTNNHMKRANSVGTLPKEFFIKGGSRSSLIETDLDTGVCTEKPLVYETDLDQLHHANRSSSVSNINIAHCQTKPPHSTQKAAEIFERTQSMTVLSDNKKNKSQDITGSAHISRVQSYTSNKQEPINSEHINRINKSLNKLHIPEWYSSSEVKDTQAVQLENTRRDTSRERSPYRVLSPQGRAKDGGVSAMIVSTKPVVIQHRVSPVVIGTPNKSHPMTGTLHQATGIPNNKDNWDFQLPSAKWKRDSHSFKPIPIKGLHEVRVKTVGQARMSAKDAYLKLKSAQEANQYPSVNGEEGLNVKTSALANNQTKQDGELDISTLSNDKRMETAHTYVNIHGELPSEDEPPPPLPPRRAKRPSSGQSWGSYSPTSLSTTSPNAISPTGKNSEATKGSLRKNTRSESSSSPDALCDSAYASMYKGYAGDTDVIKQEDKDQAKTQIRHNNDVLSSNTSKDRVNDLVSKFNANWRSYTSSVPVESEIVQRPAEEPKVFADSDKHGQYNKSGGSANIYQQDTSTKTPYQDGNEVNLWNNDNHVQSTTHTFTNTIPTTNVRREHNNSAVWKATQDKQQYPTNGFKQTMDKNSKGCPLTMPKPACIPPDPLIEKAKASPNRRVAEFAGDVEKNFPLMQYPNSPGMRKGYSPDTTLDTSRELLEKDSSVDISKGNTTFDDMLDGLLGIPSLNSSMLDTSRTSAKRESSRDTSLPSPSFESPLERGLRIISEHSTTKTNQGGNFDTSVQISSTVSMGSVGPKTLALDSSADTLDAVTSALDNSLVVKCRNPKCKKEQEIAEAKKTYKTCHNCFTYYCSRECRKAHWEKHKKKCVFSRVNSHCKHVIKKAHAEQHLNEELSKVARTGYIQKGRGSVLVIFRSLDKAAHFLKGGFESLDIPLSFISTKEIEESRLFGEHAFELLDLCRTYNPEIKYIIEVVIIAKDDSTSQPQPESRRHGSVINKCAKLRLANNNNNQTTKQSSGIGQKKENKAVKMTTSSSKVKEDNDTLILTAVPGAEFTENMEERKAREICFTNIQMKLRQRGISLRHQFPDVYKKLCMYVSDKQEFSPITLFPTDTNTGRKFMCLIMPNSEPDTEWRTRPDLMAELGLHTKV